MDILLVLGSAWANVHEKIDIIAILARVYEMTVRAVNACGKKSEYASGPRKLTLCCHFVIIVKLTL